MSVSPASLERAVASLAKGLARHETDPSDEEIRDGLIQRFEYTYDLAPKVLRRVLEESADTPGSIDAMSFPTLIRTAWEKGLLKDSWTTWLEFRKKRNITSHLYDEASAIAAAAIIPAFLEEVQFLVDRLK